jgi:hypothetical protein
METTNIYVLVDPQTNLVRYVGKANNVPQRYKAHLNIARKHQIHKLNWVNSLKNKGLKPIIEIIDVVPINEWVFWETYWISQFKTWGFDLINYTEGGDGSTFGNQTSFKKGQKPWNTGLGHTQICPVCLREYRTPKSSSSISCSIQCSVKIKKSSSTTFSKGGTPWNKDVKGYTTNKKGQSVSEEVRSKISTTLKGKGSNKKRIIKQYNINMELIKEYSSITEAVLITGIKSISNALTGRAKTAGGYIWL